MEILFSTIHGSKLYGLSNKDSDTDYYTVVANPVARKGSKFAKQTMSDGIDSMIVDIGTWLRMCSEGVPQALEAMYSTKPIVDKIGPLRAGWQCGTTVYDTYLRTIKSFALSEGYKAKRHALRLAINLAQIGEYGRFNPTLTNEDVDYISRRANNGNNDVYGLAKCIAWDIPNTEFDRYSWL